MRLTVAAVIASVLLRLGADAVLAQSAQAPPAEKRFEVASVKPALSARELGSSLGIRTQPGGRFVAGGRLKRFIAEAFEVKDYQIDGGPPWLATDYFEITANAGGEATPADIKAMLRTLLTERFGLRTHSDTRQAPMYVLTLARSDGRLGSRLTRASPECIQQIEQWKNHTAPPTPLTPEAEREQRERIETQLKRNLAGDSSMPASCGDWSVGGRANGAATLQFGGMELTSLVSQISSELSAPVLDRTELTGLFNVSLEYLSERTINGRAAGLDPNGTDVPPPTLVPALQQQLGLRLEKQIGPMPVVIIDAANHPAPD